MSGIPAATSVLFPLSLVAPAGAPPCDKTAYIIREELHQERRQKSTMHDYRAIFLDIDGTLTQPGHSAPPVSAVAAIESARRAGRRVFLCTGRCEAMLKPLLHWQWRGGGKAIRGRGLRFGGGGRAGEGVCGFRLAGISGASPAYPQPNQPSGEGDECANAPAASGNGSSARVSAR